LLANGTYLLPQDLSHPPQSSRKHQFHKTSSESNGMNKVQIMEHDENAVISDANGTVGHDEGIVDANPKETMPNPDILARNMRVAQLKH